jgi:AraC family transcriptional regulator, positive regulator of tynA and feaB
VGGAVSLAPVDREYRNPTHRQPAPQSLEFSRLTTAAVTARERFDYWRQLFIGSYIDRPPGSDATRPFGGEIVGCTDGNGVVFANLRNDPVVGTFGKRDSDLVLLGCIHRGTFQLSHGDGATTVNRSSGLLLFDCDRPAISSASRATEISYLALPRAAAATAMGSNDLIAPGTPVRLFPKSGLTRVMLVYLHALAKHGPNLDRREGLAAMKAATALATALLAGLGRKSPDEREGLEDTVFAAALHYIESNHYRHDLTADRIASAVGCSRAYLYRLFANRGQTVAGVLRDVRLQRAQMLLETELSQPIGLIAFNTGYTDLSAFGKAFKRHFGITPRDCRAMSGVPALSQAQALF